MKKPRHIAIGPIRIGQGLPLALVAGPCVIEGRAACLRLAGRLAEWAAGAAVPLLFKASYDKANRTSVSAYRGPGIEEGLDILGAIRERYQVPVLTDVHSPGEAALAGARVDVIQVPAFLSRQTDLLLAAGESGCVVAIKKGQFMAPWDIRHAVAKVESTGNRKILLMERGVSFGYNNLVADMRSLIVMRELGYPVIFDATHSVQRPGAAGGASAGDGRWVPHLARAAVATGCDGVFMETHPSPSRALSDGANMLPLRALPALWRTLEVIHAAVS